ncbi:MAG: hypothetical protein K2L14_07380 [Duncaniella sp.]|nr:hypothetical protein [Duncaniella sp.]
MKVHLFNPENDLALGIDCLNYTPSPHAKALHDAGELFPAWWAGRGDYVVAPDAGEADRSWLRENFGIITVDGFDAVACEPDPWGWSRNACRLFKLAGVGDSCLPDQPTLSLYRELSHRRTAVALLHEADYGGEMPVVTDNADVAMDTIARHGHGFVKSPWSGSGRGVFHSAGLAAAPLRRRIEGIIHRQGSVIVEKPLDKVTDMAALFYAGADGVKFHGLSLFEAEARGMYAGNIVAGQQQIFDRICSLIPESLLTGTIGKIRDGLDRILRRRYIGLLGVDMMIHRAAGGSLQLMPCIEINLRRTMGFAAMDIAARLDIKQPRRLTWHRGVLPAGAVALLRPGKEFTPVLL